jgi:hypothetical protein
MRRLMVSGAHALSAGKITDPYLERWLAMGMGSTTLYGLEQTAGPSRAARSMFKRDPLNILDPRRPWDWFKDVVQAPEIAGRTTEFERVAKDIGWKPGQYMSEGQAIQLMRASRKVTGDWWAAGEMARFWNRIIPFFNPSIQAPRAMYGGAKDHPSRFAWRAAQLAMSGLYLWYLNKDDETYQEMSDSDRFNYWSIPFTNPWTGRKERAQIPIAPDVQIFAKMAEVLADSAYRSNPQLMRSFMDNWISQMSVPFMGPWVEETLEQVANRDFYTGMPIVTRSQEDMPAIEQKGDYTTHASIWLAETLQRMASRVAKMPGLTDEDRRSLQDIRLLSPRRIDHAMRGVFGGLATDVLELRGAGATPREFELADTVVFGRLFRRGGAMGTRPKSIDELFDVLRAMDRKQRSLRSIETPLEEAQRKMFESAAASIAHLATIRSRVGDPTTRQEIVAYQAQMARHALGVYKAGGASPAGFRGMERSLGRVAEPLKQQYKYQELERAYYQNL